MEDPKTANQILPSDSVADMIAFWQMRATAHAGTAPAAIKTQSVKQLRRRFANRSENLYSVVAELCGSGDPTAEEVGVMLCPVLYDEYPQSVNSMLYRLANSDHWEVREWAASAAGDILESRFEPFAVIIRQWTADPSENIRRAAVLAIMYAGVGLEVEKVSCLLNILAPLLDDASPYVKKNLGPFALGSGLMKHHPDLVLTHIRQWVKSPQEIVRWNLAMVFSAVEGAKHAKKARDILDELASDPRASVARALTRAMKTIQVHCPEYLSG